MKLSLSNIALPSVGQERYFPRLAAMGFAGLEVAPSKVWTDVARVTALQASGFRALAEDGGLPVAGLHSLFYDQPDLGLFRGEETNRRTLDFLVHLTEVCAHLGGGFMVFGSPTARRRGTRSVEDCDSLAIEFFDRLAMRMQGSEVCLALEPLGRADSDYLHSLAHAVSLVESIGRREIRVHADAKALAESEEIAKGFPPEWARHIAHCHANSPDLGVLRPDGPVDHNALGRSLRGCGYDGFVSLEQCQGTGPDPLGPIRASVNILKGAYS